MLTESYTEQIRRHHAEGLPIAQIARLMGDSRMTVYRHLDAGDGGAAERGRTARADGAEVARLVAAVNATVERFSASGSPSWPPSLWRVPRARSDQLRSAGSRLLTLREISSSKRCSYMVVHH